MDSSADPVAVPDVVDASGQSGIVQPPHVRPWWAPLTIVAFVTLVICSNVANGVWAGWVDDHQAALLALSSRQRYLVFTAAGGIGVLPYVVIGALRIATATTEIYPLALHDARPLRRREDGGDVPSRSRL